MLPLRRVAFQSVRRFHTASLCRFPIPESSSKAGSMSSQHTAGTGMNEPGAYKSGPNAKTSTEKAKTPTTMPKDTSVSANAKTSTEKAKAPTTMPKDTSGGKHAEYDSHQTWTSADSDSTVGLQGLNKEAALKSKNKSSTVTGDVAQSASAAMDKMKKVVKNGADTVSASDVKATITNVIHKAKETVSNLTHKAADVAKEAGSKVSGVASTASNKMQDTKQNIIERANATADRMEVKFEKFGDKMMESGAAIDRRDAEPDDLDTSRANGPVGQQPNPKDHNDVMEGVPGMTKKSNPDTDKTPGIAVDRRSGGVV